MSDSIGPPPPPVPVEAEAVAPPQGPNRLGVAALVVGIVALVLAFVPFASYGAGLPAIVALVLGIVAVARSGNRKRRAGIAGIVLGIVALIAAIVMSVDLHRGLRPRRGQQRHGRSAEHRQPVVRVSPPASRRASRR